jgi:hypothetical protein
MTTKIKYNDGRMNCGRYPHLALIDRNGNLFPFRGESIVGVAVILTNLYDKNGKWSSNTYTIELADGVVSLEHYAPMHQSAFHSCGTWDDVYAEISQKLGGKRFDPTQVRAWISACWHTESERLDANEKALEALSANNTVAQETELYEVRFGNPTNRQISDGWWEQPLIALKEGQSRYDGDIIKIDWINRTCLPEGWQVLDVESTPGMHGGYRMVRVVGPVGYSVMHP